MAPDTVRGPLGSCHKLIVANTARVDIKTEGDVKESPDNGQTHGLCNKIDWIGLDMIGLDWIGLDWLD